MRLPSETASYCSWKKLVLTNEKGRKEVRFYLNRRDGSADLAIVGKENNSRRMSYRHALKTSRSVLYKLNTRGDVVDWLNSVVSDEFPQEADIPVSPMTTQTARQLNDTRCRELVQHNSTFLWMGSPWICRKRRKHYSSFCRNGVRVSVNDFVYVLAEQKKRLIAYLEDMYEDSKGNKRVMVQWFHKTDEAAIVLPRNVSEREIFFSRCLQGIDIECIDGLATVLSLGHYEKFLMETMHVQPVAFYCQKLYEDDTLKPFDITKLKGYWRQETLGYLNITITESGSDQVVGTAVDKYVGNRLRKRCRSSPVEILNMASANDYKDDHVNSNVVSPTLCKEVSKPSSSFSLSIRKGSRVEVLSQDSGLRGCWFRALIIKKHKDKVKVRYQDIQDAGDESKKLEEWILTSRVAADDPFGYRIQGRKMIRPAMESSEGNNTLCAVGVGMSVDVWWFDGWWEGIVLQKISEERFEVYLSGEKKKAVFDRNDLRLSQEWLEDQWVPIKSKSDLVSSVLSSIKSDKDIEAKIKEKTALTVATTHNQSISRAVPDLLKDVLASDLKWKTSGKRRRSKSGSRNCRKRLTSKAFKRDSKRCKLTGDSLFGSEVVPRVTRLLMS